MKFEMELGFHESEKITIETWDFDKIEIIKDFIFKKNTAGQLNMKQLTLMKKNLKTLKKKKPQKFDS